jgi:flagellar biosynthesis GTPase FlhF
MDDAVKVFVGRSLEELIPRIRAELGPDAIVLRSREKLVGGVGGFFQRSVIEVEARGPLPHEVGGDEVRSDRATTEGLASAGVAQLVAQAQPFAAQLAKAQRSAEMRAGDLLAATAADLPQELLDSTAGSPATPAERPYEHVPTGLYGPQPNLEAIDAATQADPEPPTLPLEPSPPPEPPAAAAWVPTAAPEVGGAPSQVAVPPPPPSFVPAAPAPVPSAGSPASAIERRLVLAGLEPTLAADLVGEAVDHRQPFAAGRPLEHHVRQALAARIRVMGDCGPGPRTLAVVGAGGSGKTSAVANLAVAYHAAGRRVIVLALDGGDRGRTLASRLEPLGIPVALVEQAAPARKRLAQLRPALAILDTPAAVPGALSRLQAALAVLKPDEIHLTLPATLSLPAARDAERAASALGVTHVALTFADATRHPGATIQAALEAGRPLSYVNARATLTPADPLDLATRLLP